jgi:xanthine/uracil permease
MVSLGLETLNDGLSILQSNLGLSAESIRQISHSATILGYGVIKDPDVLGQMQAAFKKFIDSGQVWALLIGLCVVYMFRNMTAS